MPHENELIELAYQCDLTNPNKDSILSKIENLLKLGANVNFRGTKLNPIYNRCALDFACSYGNVALVSVLIQRNADVNTQNSYSGSTPLHSADLYPEIIELLLQNGAKLEIRNEHGETPLLKAARCGSAAVVKLLLDRGADIAVVDKDGNSALKLAEKHYRTESYSVISDFIYRKKMAQEPPKEFLQPVMPKISQPPAQNMATIPPAASALPSAPVEILYNELKQDQKLGQGGFGIVYKGTYREHTVAIKLLANQSVAHHAEFKHEANIMFKLSSPYIVKYYGACFENQHMCLVMEYLANGSLFDFLHKPNPILWDTRYQIAVDIGCGIAYLHQQGVIHNDLKSPNILLDINYRARVSDFGLSKIKLASSITTVTGPGNGGTTRWMAPELFKENAKTTKSSDVYAFGMVLWEISARKIPFQDKAPRNEQVPFLLFQGMKETVPNDTPASMAKLIAKCWESAERRPIMKDAVEQLLEEKVIKYIRP